MLSTPLFVMKPKNEKEKMKQDFIIMNPSLKTLNCEEIQSEKLIVEKPTSKRSENLDYLTL